MPQENPQEVNRFGIIRLFAEAEEGTVVPLTVTGLSMTPFLLHKISVVYLKKERGYLPRKGDIVFFARQDLAVVLHRVVGIRKDGTLIIKGDAQRWREEIRPEQILAHVTRICRSKKVFSADHKGYRFLVALWRPFRLLHPPMAYCLNFLSRIPYKLSKKPQK